MWEEMVLRYSKEGDGNGVDTILTSPPYEQSLHEGQAGPGATSDAGAWHEGREVTKAAYTRSGNGRELGMFVLAKCLLK